MKSLGPYLRAELSSTPRAVGLGAGGTRPHFRFSPLGGAALLAAALGACVAFALAPWTCAALVAGALVLALAVIHRAGAVYLLIMFLPLGGILTISWGGHLNLSELTGFVVILASTPQLLRRVWFPKNIGVALATYAAIALASLWNTSRLRGFMVVAQASDPGSFNRYAIGSRSLLTAGWLVFSAALLLCLVQVVSSERRLIRALDMLVLAASASAVFGIAQWIRMFRGLPLWVPPGSDYHLDSLYSNIGHLLPRTPGTFSEPSVFGGFLALTLLVTVALLVRSGRNPRSGLFGAAALLQGLALLLTFSTGAYATFIAGLPVILLRKATRGGSAMAMRRLGAVVGMAGLVLAICYFALGVTPVDVANWTTGRLQGTATSALDRTALSRIALAMGSAHWISGVGLGNFPFLVYFYSYNAGIPLVQFTLQPTPSNLFLLTWAEIGLPGLLSLIWLLIAIWRYLKSPMPVRPGRDLTAERTGLCAALAAIAASFLLLDNLFAVYISVLLALALANTRIGRAEPEPEHP